MGGTIKKKKGTSSNCFCWLLEEGGGGLRPVRAEKREERGRERPRARKKEEGGEERWLVFPRSPTPQIAKNSKSFLSLSFLDALPAEPTSKSPTLLYFCLQFVVGGTE